MAAGVGGIRWQVWAGVLGGVGGMVALIFVLTRAPAPAPTPKRRKAAQAAQRSGGNWSTGGFSRRSRRSRRVALAKRRQALSAPTARGQASDAGTPDGVTPELPPDQKKPAFKKPGWLRGKVVAVPGRKPLKTFVIRYARTKRSFWSRSSKPKARPSKPGFPKDAVIQTKTISHEKGHFDIKLEAGTYVVQIKAKGYKDSTPTPARASAARWYRRTFAMLQGGRSQLLGRVVGRGGKPVTAATAFALIQGGSRWGWRMMAFGRSPSAARMASTDEEGRFAIKELPAGKYGVMVRASGYTTWQKRGILLADGEHKDLGTIQLDGNTGTIQGTVFAQNGEGKSGAVVVAIGSKKGRRDVKFTRTDASGKYTLADVSAGSVRLFARLGRGTLASAKTHNLTLKVGQTVTHDFHFGHGGYRLFGKVYNADGSPVANAEVSATSIKGKGFSAQYSSGSATTDKDGNYSIAGLKQGVHTIRVSIEKRPSSGGEVDLQQAEKQHDIRLQGGSIKVTFVDKKTQQAPKVPAWAILTWKSTKTHRLSQRADTGKHALFEHLPSQAMQLSIFSPGYASQRMDNVEPGLPGNPKLIKIALVPAGKFLLSLTAPKGATIGRVIAQVSINGKYQWVFVQSRPGGGYELSGLSPGPAQLKITVEGFEPLEVNVNVPSKTRGQATFALTPKAADKPAPRP